MSAAGTMHPSTFRAAIFDMDGLLIDSERAIMRAWIAGARELGIALAEDEFVQCVGRAAPESDAILAGLLGSQEAFHAAGARARALLRQGASGAPGGEPVFPLKPGAFALLDALREAGVPCAVASSSRVSEIRHRLGAVGVLDFFQAVTGGDEVPRGKPDPAIYLLAASRLDAAPADCIAFEDSENGAKAAQAAGIRVVVVPDLRHPAPEVLARSHHVLPSLEDAMTHVPHWFPRI
jgi:beta-phosphoglucomutase-like phosphatase (HAD superfamily)